MKVGVCCLIFLLFFITKNVLGDMPPCVKNPGANCSAYQYPDSMSQTNVLMMCSMMPDMSICVIKTLCVDKTVSGTYCSWFSLYKQSCTEKMIVDKVGNMTDTCADYKSMCAQGSPVLQCNTNILNLPGKQVVENDINGICNGGHQMSECDCPTCEPLVKYSNLCRAMSGMPQCSDWDAMCHKIPNWPLCKDTPGNVIPEMRMFFHLGIVDYILFESWVPYDVLTYTISLIAVFFMALLHEGFKVVKVNLEARWKLTAKYEPLSRNSSSIINSKTHITITYAPFEWKRDLLRAIYRTIDVALHFFLMLVTMTFNAGLFIAVVLGYGAGHLVFSRLSKPQLITGGTFAGLEEETCH